LTLIAFVLLRGEEKSGWSLGYEDERGVGMCEGIVLLSFFKRNKNSISVGSFFP